MMIRNRCRPSSTSSSSSLVYYCNWWWTSLLLSSLVITLCQANSFKVFIPPEEDVCFRIKIPKGKKSFVSGLFQVEDDDVKGTDFSMYIVEGKKKQTGTVVYQSPPGSLEGTISIPEAKPKTTYTICFQSHLSSTDVDDDDADITVGFSIRVSTKPVRSLEDGVAGPDEQRALDLVEKSFGIHEDWNTFLDLLDFAHNREAVYEEIGHAILYRLARWTYIEAFLVIGMATGQVMYWKKFFETRRYL